MPLSLRQWMRVAAVAIPFALLTVSSHAATPRFNKPFVAEVQQKPLPDFLREFAASQGMSSSVDKTVDGTISGSFRQPPAKLLSLLETAYGITWYYDGAILYFTRVDQNRSRVVKLGDRQPAAFQSTLDRLGISDNRFPLRFDNNEHTVYVSGPPRYVEAVADAAKSRGGTSPEDEEIRLFPLKYAWAQDKSMNWGGRQVSLPGVATTLRNLFKSDGGKQKASADARGGEPSEVRGMTPIAGGGGVDVPEAMSDQIERKLASQGSHSSKDGGFPQITPDGRLNAVIVRDYAYRMDSYERLIKALDIKPILVEIEARIIDVESESLDRIGVNWSYDSARTAVSLSFDNATQQGGLSSGGAVAPSAIGGATPNPVLSTILRNSARTFIFNIEALSKDGKARVLAEPRVLTIDNIQASLVNTRTFYVRVAGFQATSLFNVETGTKMRVTPLAIPEPDGTRRVQLAIDIEDGALSSTQQVDQIPVVANRQITTQAIVREGESLLIGGLVYEQSGSSLAGLPVLSKIPVLGGLFRRTEENSVRTERLYLITPRLIEG